MKILIHTGSNKILVSHTTSKYSEAYLYFLVFLLFYTIYAIDCFFKSHQNTTLQNHRREGEGRRRRGDGGYYDDDNIDVVSVSVSVSFSPSGRSRH